MANQGTFSHPRHLLIWAVRELLVSPTWFVTPQVSPLFLWYSPALLRIQYYRYKMNKFYYYFYSLLFSDIFCTEIISPEHIVRAPKMCNLCCAHTLRQPWAKRTYHRLQTGISAKIRSIITIYRCNEKRPLHPLLVLPWCSVLWFRHLEAIPN